MILLQPLLGILHHRNFKETGRRGFWSILHLVIGRTVIILGIVNGGLGLALAGDAPAGIFVTYGIIGGMLGVPSLAAALFEELKRYGWNKLGDAPMNDEGIRLRDSRPAQVAK